MTDRAAVLDQIAALMIRHGLSLDDIAAHLNKGAHTKTPERQSTILKTLFGYMGGIFVFSGIGLLVRTIWHDITPAQHVIITLGSGMVAFALGLLMLRDARFSRAATPLFLIAALLQPTGIVVFLKEFVPPSGDPKLAFLLIMAVMTAQQALAFWSVRRTSLLFLSLVFWNASIGTALSWLHLDGELTGTVCGISMLLLTWSVDKTAHRSITPLWYFVGGAVLLTSFWALVDHTPMDLLYLGVNAFLIYASIRVASRSLLFVSVIGLLGYLSYFTATYFADVIGWSVSLIALGFAMIGISAYTVKLAKVIGKAQ